MNTALTCSLGMHDSLRNSLPVKVSHFISENHILDKKGPSGPYRQNIEFVSYWITASSGQDIRFLSEHERKRVQEHQYHHALNFHCHRAHHFAFLHLLLKLFLNFLCEKY